MDSSNSSPVVPSAFAGRNSFFASRLDRTTRLSLSVTRMASFVFSSIALRSSNNRAISIGSRLYIWFFSWNAVKIAAAAPNSRLTAKLTEKGCIVFLVIEASVVVLIPIATTPISTFSALKTGTKARSDCPNVPCAIEVVSWPESASSSSPPWKGALIFSGSGWVRRMRSIVMTTTKSS